MTEPTPAHLVPTPSLRGFNSMPTLVTAYGEKVRLYESSAADGPHVWLAVNDASAHMTLAQLQKLIDQAQWLIANHYQKS